MVLRQWVVGDERVYNVHVGTDEQSNDSEAEETGGANWRPDRDMSVVGPSLFCVS